MPSLTDLTLLSTQIITNTFHNVLKNPLQFAYRGGVGTEDPLLVAQGPQSSRADFCICENDVF